MKFSILYVPTIILSLVLLMLVIHFCLAYEDVSETQDQLAGRVLLMLALTLALTIYTYQVELLLNQIV